MAGGVVGMTPPLIGPTFDANLGWGMLEQRPGSDPGDTVWQVSRVPALPYFRVRPGRALRESVVNPVLLLAQVLVIPGLIDPGR